MTPKPHGGRLRDVLTYLKYLLYAYLYIIQILLDMEPKGSERERKNIHFKLY